ncbi:MAG: glycosyltransferase [Actinomycetota bacterium]|nr:glycosyltransferase [Actinomycetota bacterium]
MAIVTHNRRERLLGTLAHLQRLPEGPSVVVLDNGSDDGTIEAVMEQFPDVTVLESHADLGAAGGRNALADWSNAPYLAFCRDDAAWAPGALAVAAALFEAHDDVALLSAPGDPAAPDASARTGLAPRVPRRTTLGAPVRRFPCGAAVVRRRAFDEVGGFDGRLPIGVGEELLAIDLTAAGWRTATVAALAVCRAVDDGEDLGGDGGADPTGPAGDAIRDELWTAWLRRSSPAALVRTGSVLRSLPRDQASVRAVADALRGLPRVLRSRRPVPTALERELRRRDRVSPASLAAITSD